MKRSSRYSLILRPAAAAVATMRHWCLWLLTSRPAVALQRRFSDPDLAAWRWETEPLRQCDKVCVFVTYSPDGQIPERASRHAAIWRDEGYEVLFVIALDDFSIHPPIPFGHAICRENIGHDFAAWSRAIAEIPLDATKVLATVNDSVFASRTLAKAIQNAEKSDADMVGFTENREGRWHIQSYAVIFKEDCIRSEAFRRFWQPRLGSRLNVILTYEIQLAQAMRRSGNALAIMFPLPVVKNPTIHHWPQLLDLGFPYLKRSEFARRREEWLPLVASHGFDAELIERDCSLLTSKNSNNHQVT